MGWRGWLVLVMIAGCGRTPLFGDRLALSGGADGDGSADDVSDDGDSNDGPIAPDEVDLPSDESPFDVGSELPPAVCGMLPPTPAAAACKLPSEPQQLFSGEGFNAVLTVDDDWVYAVINRSPASEVVRIDKCSGDFETLAAEGLNPANVIVVDDHVVWTDYIPDGGVWQVPIEGGEPVAIATSNSPLALAVFDPWIVYSSYEGVFRILLGGGDVEPVVESSLRFFVSFASDGVALFGNVSSAQAIGWINPANGAYGEVAVSSFGGDVVADCQWVFWSDDFTNLHRIDRTTGDDEDLGYPVYRFVHDETHVFASTGDSQVIAIDKATAESRVVADLPGELPWRIAVDATHVYWTTARTGDVWSARNPWL